MKYGIIQRSLLTAQCYKIWFGVTLGEAHQSLYLSCHTWSFCFPLYRALNATRYGLESLHVNACTHEASVFLNIQRLNNTVWSHNRKAGDSKWSESESTPNNNSYSLLFIFIFCSSVDQFKWTGTPGFQCNEASDFLYIQRSDMVWSHNRKAGDS